MGWLDKLSEYAPDIVAAVVSGGATLPALALKAVADATGKDISTMDEMEKAVSQATPGELLKLKQANNSFKIKMAELANELTATELGDIQHAREQHKQSIMPALICGFLTIAITAFAGVLMVAEIPVGNVRILDTLFGTFLTAWLGSITYWIGTTRSSAQKTQMLKAK